MYIMTINEKREDNLNERRKGHIGRIWRKESEDRNDAIILQSQK